MPMRLRRSLRALTLLAVGGCLVGGVAGAAEREDRGERSVAWQGLLGSRPAAQLTGRFIIVFNAPSLADRVKTAGGRASEKDQKRWTAAAEAAQDRLLARLAADGAGLAPEHRYVRVLNAIAAALDPRVLPVLEKRRFVAGVYPVRAAYPAAVSREGLPVDLDDQPRIAIPGKRGRDVEVALLDTGVDLTHPYLVDRLLPGIDVVDPGGDASARQNPTERGRAERHGTEMAGIAVGSGGPDGLRGIAPRASLRPIRIAGWQPDGAGGVSVYARTDQLIAGLEAAVDPN
ncbi:MAG: hypothetical protein FJW96_15435, partial [Actinobacteria bacterium]|nr:hypothetical protein [Actinomycetota bacterium]